MKQSLMGMIQDSDFDNLKDLTVGYQRRQSPDKMSSFTETKTENDSVKVAARTVSSDTISFFKQFLYIMKLFWQFYFCYFHSKT